MVPGSVSEGYFYATLSSPVILEANASVGTLVVSSDTTSPNAVTLNLNGFTMAPSRLYVGAQWDTNTGGPASFTVTGNGTLSPLSENIGSAEGDGQVGTMTQDGGLNSTYYFGVNGTYNLDGGTLSVAMGEELLSALDAPADFVQAAGTNTTGSLYLLSEPNASGTLYQISGGTLSAGTLCVGGRVLSPGMSPTPGLGTLSVQSGATVSAGSMTVTSEGQLQMSGGLLTVGTFNQSATPSNFTWTGGELVVDGADTAADGSLTVPQNCTLGGTGTINRPLTVAGTLSPGDPSSTSTGSLTLASGLSLQSGSTLSVRTGDTPTTSDELDLASGYPAGSISLSGVTLNVIALANTTVGQQYQIVSATNDPTSTPFSGTFAALKCNLPAATYTVTYDQSDGAIDVTFTSLPEPSIASGSFLLAIHLGSRRARRKPRESRIASSEAPHRVALAVE